MSFYGSFKLCLDTKNENKRLFDNEFVSPNGFTYYHTLQLYSDQEK